MKKLFTLAMLLVLALTVNAQETYRKSWDFTKWSATTVANLKAEAVKSEVKDLGDGKTQLVDDHGALWSDHEKAVGKDCTSYGASKDGKCFWATSNNNVGGDSLKANGELIPELAGLYFNKSYTSARSLAIGVDYNSAGGYQGASYLWFGGSKKDIAVIRGVAPGTTIKMGVESHKTTEARGIELYLVKNATTLTHGTKLKDPDGNEVAIPTTYQDLEWLLPAEDQLTDADKQMANEDGTYNVLIYHTNGCHVYYITVGDGDSPVVEDAKKVAYLTGASFSADDDIAYIMLDGNDKFDVTPVAISAEVTRDSLANFDAVVIAPTIGAAEAAIIKPYIAFLPIVNLSSAIYEPLGLGKAVSTETTDLTIKDAGNAIFEGMEAISYDGFIDAVELGDYFAKDDTLALAGEAVAIHAHNAGRNAYYYIPGTNLSEDVYLNLIPQTVLAVAKTKRAITAVGKPAITFKQEDGQSIVTIAAANSKAIYYTLDGTDPTTASTLYTEPFTLTEATTVKAFAIGDGYLDSEIATNEVTIAVKAAKPTIAIAREAGKSTVTLNAAEGIDIYFNFTQSETQAEAQKYDAPIEMMEPSYITFFAVGENLLQSDATTEFVGIDGIDKTNIRWDILAHMDANKDDWSTVGSEESRSSKVNYFFGKNAQSMYTDEIESQEPVRDSLGNIIKSQLDPEMDSVLTVYKKVEQIVVPNVSNTWKVTSYGQVMTWENPVPGKNVGVAGSNCPELAADHMPVNGTDGVTNYMLNFKGKKSGEPYNATIQTVEAYQGPFDIVVYFNNGSAGSYPKVDVEYSLDEKEWVKIDTLETRDVRLMKRNKLSYEGTDKVFIRLAHKGGNSAGQVFDIYLLNNGELSQNYNEEETGIQTVQPEGPVVRTEFFTLGGSRMNNAGRGIQIIRTTYANGTVVTKKVIR
ncbi:chitobiase/beta-hexosaminidase C-terminal domain-containing protein [Prevotella sp. E13-27]|uniref:chitobiase/beta-hexosaminidase C-terminal domain-containing protein n=1 Tax=Prevotella sp. E13-27 TaxID=2938122 RepID=UPI00200AE323|nr:chitobiase/beta-hexosaminidase C-terminal domain-containing protein [Prevotella sp. E13-27]MCK8621290.1 chitobiase/beta-hexosaminidase C-terminal domain-containing protein [Prevotella sp. E13-27]